MKYSWLPPLPVLLLAMSASAVTLDTPATPQGAQAMFGADLERELATLERDEQSAKQELTALASQSEVQLKLDI